MISSFFSNKLNALRAIAAIFVMLGHVRGAYFVSYNDLIPESKNIFNFLFFAITRLGHQFVIVFFVLSGFLVGGLSLNAQFKGKLSIKKYFIKRITRMWVVLIPTLIIGGLINYYSGVTTNLSSSVFFGNLTFLQTIVVPVYGNNGPLWSLAYEFWYYMLFMLFLIINKKITINTIKIALSVVILVTASLLMPNIILLFPIWLMGVIIPFVPKLDILTNKYFSLIVKIAFLPIILLANYFSNFIISDFVLGAYITLFLLVLKYSDKVFKDYKLVNVLSNLSFSLYAIHYPILIFGIVYFSHKRIDNINSLQLILFLILNVLLVFCSYLFYLISEKHTSKFSRYLIKKYN